MKTIISKIDINNIDKKELKKQAELLADGNTVIFPTETVYGLGANALDEDAVIKIYEAKGRPSDNPLIVHVCEKEEIYDLAENVSDKAEVVMDKFWPGPLTIILNKKSIVPYRTSGGLETVAIRMPSHPIAREIIKQSGVPIAAPSANISGRPSPTKANHVYEEMNGRVSGIVLGGDCSFGLESTVLDMTGDTPMILRPGSVTKEDLEEIIGEVAVDPSLAKKEDNKKAKAPGMKYTHYAPDAEVYIVSGESNKVISEINKLVDENKSKNLKTGIMCLERNKEKYNGEVISLGNTLDEVGSNLFDVLREMDKRNIDIVYSEEFPNTGVGQAIMNRLLKSAGYKIIKVQN
ncbi:MAG: L-threonylcarbamoyladenylate synthase [Peptostreptococcaceae bacterium]